MGNFFTHFIDKNQVQATGAAVSSGSGISDGAKNYQMLNAIKNVLPGQTVSGEVLSVNGREVQLSMGGDLVLTARLEQDMNVMVGQLLNLEVKANSDNQLLLRPLLTNLGKDENLFKSLDAANLPANQKTLAMVSDLMEEGMPIDKQTLQQMYKQIISNPEVSGKYIVQMNRLQIPVTPEQIQQFEAYKNNEHQLLNGIKTVIDELPSAIRELLQAGEGTEPYQALTKLIETFLNKESEMTGGNPAVLDKGIGQAMLSEAGADIAKGSTGEISTLAGAPISTEAGAGTDAGIPGLGTEALARTVYPETGSAEINPEAKEVWNAGNTSGLTEGHTIADILSKREIDQMVRILEESNVPKEKIEQISSGRITSQEFLQFVETLLEENHISKDKLTSLLTGKAFTDILKEEVGRQWLLEPLEVGKEEKVQKLYARMYEQTQKLIESMNGIAKENSPLLKTAASLKENVDFMNQINQVYNYVQLPLKMGRDTAHGDLYVYTNKKNLASRDGNVSALLHFDMEHLGAMDIYVTMQQKNISTKFYLEKEEYLDFIEENLHILNARLEKRGYHMHAEVLASERNSTVIDEILKKEKGNTVLEKYSFDVRA